MTPLTQIKPCVIVSRNLPKGSTKQRFRIDRADVGPKDNYRMEGNTCYIRRQQVGHEIIVYTRPDGGTNWCFV